MNVASQKQEIQTGLLSIDGLYELVSEWYVWNSDAANLPSLLFTTKTRQIYFSMTQAF